MKSNSKKTALLLIQVFLLLFLFFISFTSNSISQSLDSSSLEKKVSVTIDDLPLNIALKVSTEEMKSIDDKLISGIRVEGIPVVGFVNENKLEVNGKLDRQRVDIVKSWLDSGIELGNHTYSHKSANVVPVDEFEKDIIHGETTVRKLMTERGMKLRYFRYPFLMTGRSLEVKNEIAKFLSDHNYMNAPVTIDNSEWIFSVAFDKARMLNDTVLMNKVGQEYIGYMKAKFQYYERQSVKLFGRLINQILLIHSNRLNSYYFNTLCSMIKDLGYRFIALDEALKDPAYSTRDTFTGRRGISWLDRWAITLGKPKEFFIEEPRTPIDIMQLAQVESE